jgi:hypothetical protein
MPRYEAARPIFRHHQDTPFSCGRACAQMVISSLTQGPVSGSSTTPGLSVPVLQSDLQSIEQETADQPSPPAASPHWYTHPDELAHVLQNTSTLLGVPGFTPDWRVSHHPTADLLMADLIISLRDHQMPAILNIRPIDHWVVLKSIDVDAGEVTGLQMLDPVFSTPVVAREDEHLYRDGCGLNSHGTSWWTTWDLEATELPTYSLQVGTIPPPAPLIDYSNQYVAIVHGAPPPAADISKVASAVRFSRRKPIEPPPGPDPLGRLREALRLAARPVDIPELHDLLDPPPPATLRLVRDIQGSPRYYRLASAFSATKQRGVVAVVSPSGVLRHFALHASADFAARLALNPQEDLWWTTAYLPSLPSPYYPFRRVTEGNKTIFRRIGDDLVIASAATPA